MSSVVLILLGSSFGIIGTCLVFQSKIIRYKRLKKGLIYEIPEEASIATHKEKKELKKELIGFGFQIMAFIILALVGICGFIFP